MNVPLMRRETRTEGRMSRSTAVKVFVVALFFPALVMVNLWQWAAGMSDRFAALKAAKPDTNRLYHSAIRLPATKIPPIKSLAGLAAPKISELGPRILRTELNVVWDGQRAFLDAPGEPLIAAYSSLGAQARKLGRLQTNSLHQILVVEGFVERIELDGLEVYDRRTCAVHRMRRDWLTIPGRYPHQPSEVAPPTAEFETAHFPHRYRVQSSLEWLGADDEFGPASDFICRRCVVAYERWLLEELTRARGIVAADDSR